MSIDVHELVKRLKALSSELDGRTPTLREFEQSGVSKRQILKHKYSELCKMAGLEINKHAQTTEPIEPVIRPPRILIFDIETSYMLVKTYSLRTDYISHKNIVNDWHLLSYAGKFRGEDKFYYLDQRYAQDKSDDRQLAEGLHDLISQADILVGHNLDRFDLKKFNTRAAKYNLPPIAPKITHDTLKILRKYFALSSNSLEYAAKFLQLKNRKSSHGKFPGDSLWEECLKGNVEAWEECRLYNQQDCAVTEELFDFLAKYEPSINYQAFYQAQVCQCGSEKFFKDGFKYTRQGKFQVFRCHKCSKTFQGKENLIDKDMRSRFTR